MKPNLFSGMWRPNNDRGSREISQGIHDPLPMDPIGVNNEAKGFAGPSGFQLSTQKKPEPLFQGQQRLLGACGSRSNRWPSDPALASTGSYKWKPINGRRW